MVDLILIQSHFSFYPYLFCPSYPQTQIQQNLQSLSYLPYCSTYSNSLFPIPFSSQNMSNFRQDFQLLNPICANNGILFCNYEKLQFPCNSTNIKNFQETRQIKKQQTNEKQQGSSLQDDSSSERVSRNEKLKGIKKYKLKKLLKKEKKERQLKRNSSENAKRNIIPNEIHQILSIILKKNKSAHLVEKLLLKYSSEKNQTLLSIQRFYLYQSLIKEKINHYANQESLRYLFIHLEPEFIIYNRQEQEIYCKVGLMLISYFLRNQAALIILNSQRIKSSNKLDHLKAKRYLQNFIEQIIQETFHQKKGFTIKIKQEQLVSH